MTDALWPERVQQRRTRGWRMPPGAVSVARPHRYGNPFIVSKDQTAEQAVANFRRALLEGRLQFGVQEVRRQLAGKDLACWCRPGQPCHADVLLEIANSDTPPTPN